MIVIDLPQDLSEDEEGELVAYVDGRLEPDGRGGSRRERPPIPPTTRPSHCQQQGRKAIAPAAESTGAPLALRTRVEAPLGPGRRHGERRPSARTRLGGIRWPGAGLVPAALAAVLAAVVLVGGGPDIEDVAAAAVRPPTAAIAPVPAESKVLDERQGEVVFPNFAREVRLGGHRHAHRRDRGRETRTVFYEKDGARSPTRGRRRRARSAR